MPECWRSHPALFNYVCVYYLPSKTRNSQQRKTESSSWLDVTIDCHYSFPSWFSILYPWLSASAWYVNLPSFPLHLQRFGMIPDGAWSCSSLLFLRFLSRPQHFVRSSGSQLKIDGKVILWNANPTTRRRFTGFLPDRNSCQHWWIFAEGSSGTWVALFTLGCLQHLFHTTHQIDRTVLSCHHLGRRWEDKG